MARRAFPRRGAAGRACRRAAIQAPSAPAPAPLHSPPSTLHPPAPPGSGSPRRGPLVLCGARCSAQTITRVGMRGHGAAQFVHVHSTATNPGTTTTTVTGTNTAATVATTVAGGTGVGGGGTVANGDVFSVPQKRSNACARCRPKLTRRQKHLALRPGSGLLPRGWREGTRRAQGPRVRSTRRWDSTAWLELWVLGMSGVKWETLTHRI